MDIVAGTRLGHYEIHYQLGAGGMGKVYFARDTKLSRPVALKLLSPELTANKEHLHRFEQEARLTSNLNHPNILTIYEIGKVDSTHYIATEFIDGQTLRRRLADRKIEHGEVLDISIQVASALAAAHEAGIIHRDIKPENIMLRPDGYVKVLDFGLAKLTEKKAVPIASPEALTITNLDTDPGAILGTILYMSPEQLRGQKVDARTDVWSFGVLLYEMLAGHAPFDWSTKSDAIASILTREPLPLAKRVSDLPVEFERIVSRALHKNREERYQSVKELLSDLKRLKRDLDLEIGHASAGEQPDSGGPVAPSSVNNQPLITDINRTSPRTNELELKRNTSSIGSLIGEVKNYKRGLFLLLTALVLAAGLAYVYLSLMQRKPGMKTAQLVFNKIPLAGNVKEAAISPDGKYIAAIIDELGSKSIWVRQISTSSNLQIVPPEDGRYKGLVFSPDGDYIHYLKEEGDTSALYKISVLGGTPRKLASHVDTMITLSPDSTRLAFIRLYSEEGYSTSLIIANADGTGEQRLVTLTRPQAFSLGFFSSGPVWSPDGKVIACPAINITDRSSVDVVAVRVTDGTIKPINTQRWLMIEKLVWLSDGSGLLMNAIDRKPSALQVWSLSYPNGEASRITNDPNAYIGLSMTRDSKTLLLIKTSQLSNIWVLTFGGAPVARQITSSRNDGSTGISWVADGRIVYASNETGSQNIWIMDADGNHRKQLTFDDHVNIEPVISPDGRYVVFASFGGDQPHVWRMEASGANPKQLTNGDYEDLPVFSPDGRWVIYHSLYPVDSIWKIPTEGGDPVRLTKEPATQPDISPDGKLIACFSRGESANAPWKLAVIPAEGGLPLKTFELPSTVEPSWPGVRWAPDGLSVTYVATSGGVSNIWRQPLSGGAAKQLTEFQENQIYAFAWSGNGRLICARGMVANDLLLVQDFK